MTHNASYSRILDKFAMRVSCHLGCNPSSHQLLHELLYFQMFHVPKEAEVADKCCNYKPLAPLGGPHK